MRTNDQMIQDVFARRNEKTHQPSRRIGTKIASLCVALSLCLTMGVAVWNFANADNEFVITIDVNPSIQLDVEDGTVVSAEALNTDAENIIKEIDVAGKKVEDAGAQIAQELVENGYISAESNSVLISVEGKNEEKGAELGKVLSASIEQNANDHNIAPSILVQNVSDENGKVDDIATQYGISHGKAQLIETIIRQDSFQSFDELAKMSIHELNVLRISNYIESDVQSSGVVSLMQYISEDKAKEIALENAGVDSGAVAAFNIRLDCRNGMIVYALEFEDSGKEYRYYINAVTSEVVSAESSALGANNFFVGDTPLITVGETAALDAAVKHAGATNALIRSKIQRDWVDGRVVYKVYFSDGTIYGNYVLDAKTGEILKYSKADEHRKIEITEAVIGEKAAKTYALAKNGLVDGNVSKSHMTLTQVDGQYVYSLEYLCDGARYLTTVNALDGAILENEKIVLAETGAPSVEPDGGNASVE